ncbi:MAG TPA: aroma-sacti cluster domain-containing protein [Streptomyces sp.]|nr:aroma-sacti cluster domain-containing protein [Streptomyces sp.]
MIARLYARGVLVQGTWPPLPAESQECRQGAESRGTRPGRTDHSIGAVDLVFDWPPYGNEVPVAMSFDALEALREAGHPVDLLAVGQRSVLSELSEAEVGVLNRLKGRLEAVAGDVEGQELKLL